jgi:diphthamide synthase (EF-2-diphthine--ammonia ligase)
LLDEFINLGFKAIVVSIDAGLLDVSFAGRIIDQDFTNELPHGVDVCGENGEFHTFCFDGPIFKNPI